MDTSSENPVIYLPFIYLTQKLILNIIFRNISPIKCLTDNELWHDVLHTRGFSLDKYVCKSWISYPTLSVNDF